MTDSRKPATPAPKQLQGLPLRHGSLDPKNWLFDICNQGLKVLVSDYIISHGKEGDRGQEKSQMTEGKFLPREVLKPSPPRPNPPGTYVRLELFLSFLRNVPRLWPDPGRRVCVYVTRQKLLCETWRMSGYIPNLNVCGKTPITELFQYNDSDFPVRCPLFLPSFYTQITARYLRTTS